MDCISSIPDEVDDDVDDNAEEVEDEEGKNAEQKVFKR